MMRLLAVAAADPSRPPVRFAETLLREEVTVDGHARGGGGGFQLLPLFFDKSCLCLSLASFVEYSVKSFDV